MQRQKNKAYRCKIQYDTRIMCKDDYNHDLPQFQRNDFWYFDKSTCSSSIYPFEKENHGKLRNQNDATENFQLFLRILYFFLQILKLWYGPSIFPPNVTLYFSAFWFGLRPPNFFVLYFSFLIFFIFLLY